MNLSDHPRYQGDPMHLLFEIFIQDVIGQLPEEKRQAVERMDLPRALQTQAQEWRGAIAEALRLSGTIRIAILDLWAQDQEACQKLEVACDPVQFSMDFVDHYYEEGSRIDVWEGNALEAAKARIARQGQKG